LCVVGCEFFVCEFSMLNWRKICLACIPYAQNLLDRRHWPHTHILICAVPTVNLNCHPWVRNWRRLRPSWRLRGRRRRRKRGGTSAGAQKRARKAKRDRGLLLLLLLFLIAATIQGAELAHANYIIPLTLMSIHFLLRTSLKGFQTALLHHIDRGTS